MMVHNVTLKYKPTGSSVTCLFLFILALLPTRMPAGDMAFDSYAVTNYQEILKQRASLQHYYTFDANPLEDKKGQAGLVEVHYGDGQSVEVLPGLDGASMAIYTKHSDDDGSDRGSGAYYRTIEDISLGEAVTVETIFRPSSPVGTGYIASVAGRGYFLILRTDRLAHRIGNQDATSYTKDGSDYRVDFGSWYYFAASFEVDEQDSVIITPYVANLTDGETILSVLDPVVLPDEDRWAGTSPFGVGGFQSRTFPAGVGAANAFPGMIDEMALHGAVLSREKLQEHLDALYEPYIVPADYASWISGFDLPDELKAPEANPSGDGVSNAAKYAFGLDPRVSARGKIPPPTFEKIDGEQYLILEMPRNPGAMNVEYIVEVSGDLVGWKRGPEHVTLLEETGARIRGRDTMPVGAADRRFMRIRNLLVSEVELAEIETAIELTAPVEAFGEEELPPLEGRIRLESSKSLGGVRVVLEDGEGSVLLEEQLTELPEGVSEIFFDYPGKAVTPWEAEETFTLRVEGDSGVPLEPVVYEMTWRPVTVRLNNSGEPGEVLKNTLVELSVGMNHVDLPPDEEFDMEVRYRKPSGEWSVRSARAVRREGFSNSYVERIAPRETGEWTYRFELVRQGDEDRVSLGAGVFAVFDFEAEIPLPDDREVPAFRLLYNKDPLLTSQPRYQEGATVGERLIASVEELAEKGVDVQLMSPSFTWVPWWQSNFYPIDEHVWWFRQKYGFVPSNAIIDYVREGGDLVEEFVGAARAQGHAPFLHIRLNDHHRLERTGEDVEPTTVRHESRIYDEHPEFRLGPPGRTWREEVVWNWAIPEARAYIFSFIYELAMNYHIDGIELDFLRHYSFFRDEVPEAERIAVMTGFVRDVRRILDATAPEGERRWLAVRIPARLSGQWELGIDVMEFAHAGVDIMNLSAHFYTDMGSDFAAIRDKVPSVALYLEIAHTSSVPRNRSDIGWDDSLRQLTSDQQIYTMAHLAYQRGLEGVSLFNWPIYKTSFDSEPPLHVIPCLGQPECVGQKPQHYFVSWVPGSGPTGLSSLRSRQVTTNQPLAVNIDLAEPSDGWSGDGRLRFHVEGLDPDSQWEVLLNGNSLQEVDDVSFPYFTPYHEGFGPAEEYLGWQVPIEFLQEGENLVEVRLNDGPNARIGYMDLAVE